MVLLYYLSIYFFFYVLLLACACYRFRRGGCFIVPGVDCDRFSFSLQLEQVFNMGDNVTSPYVDDAGHLWVDPAVCCEGVYSRLIRSILDNKQLAWDVVAAWMEENQDYHLYQDQPSL